MRENGDALLIEDCLRGDRAALEVLLRRYEGPVYNAVFRMLRDPDDARDVTQTVYLKVVENLSSYDSSFKFYSWLYRIAINESLNWLKRSGRRSAHVDADVADDRPGPESAAHQLEINDHVQAGLDELPAGDRAVIVLKYFLDCSYEDIGGVLDIPVKTVKSRLFSARQRLRGVLSERGVLGGRESAAS
jgi:RNA polymerase sigma-70 factor (ECF subfamily)